MSMGELLLTFFVALLVFGPQRLPLLAKHLAAFFNSIHRLKQQAAEFWQAQLQEQQLLENHQKARQADATYNDSQTELPS